MNKIIIIKTGIEINRIEINRKRIENMFIRVVDEFSLWKKLNL